MIGGVFLHFMNTRSSLLLLPVFLFVLVACGLGGCDRKAGSGAGDEPPQKVGVVTLHPQPAKITIELPGRTASFRMAEVRPQVSGIILDRLFTEGGHVKAGQPLYQIDPATYEAAYHRAQAAVTREEAAVNIAQILARRRKNLMHSNVISQQDRDDAVAALKKAEANLAVARADLEIARIDLVYTKVLSPIDGTIGRSSVTKGALVTSGQDAPLATVQQLDPIYVDVTQPSIRHLHLQRKLAAGELKGAHGLKDAEVRLILADGTEYPEVGKLQFSEVSVDPGTGSVTLRAEFPNPRRELLPGMFVRAVVSAGTQENALLVPQRGVTHNQRGEPTSLVVGKDNIVELRVLEVSRTLGDAWLVTKGLSAGDRVIVEGLQKTRPGAKVKPVELATPEPSAAGSI